MSETKKETNEALFYATLKKRVELYFKQNEIKTTGNKRLYIKTSILLNTLITLYITLIFFGTSISWLSLFLCVLMGINFAAIGFNVMHDGAHGSYSKRHWVNEMMSYALNMMGGNNFLWKQKHNVNHHSFTNIEEADEDIDVKPFMRMNTNQSRYWFHRFQHIYGMFFYGFTYLAWIFYNDFVKYFTGTAGGKSVLSKMKTKDHLVFWCSKLFYLSVFLFIPFYTQGILNTLIGYGIMAFTTGLVIAMVFQLAHVVETTRFVSKETHISEPKKDWAIHQLQTTANFGTESKWLSWILGGLNFQVEHHLFPRISHVHYPDISKIVRETCKEFNIMYNEFPSMLSAIRSHFMHLKNVGMA